MPDQKLLLYRETLARYTLLTLNSGNSVSLVGVGSVGKSNLMRHLLKREVQAGFLGPEAENLHLIYIDPNNMLDPLPMMNGSDAHTPWAGYEIMTQRLYRYFWARQDTANPQIEQALAQAYQQLHNGNNPLTPHVALRHFEYAVDLIIRAGNRLVFMFDEFELMMKELSPKFFRTLRGLRDDYKYQLMYLTGLRKPLPDLIAENNYDYDGLEPFIELFSDTTRFISAYSSRDALDMVTQMAERQMIQLSERTRDALIRLSGGHGGLLRAAFSVAGDIQDQASDEQTADRLARYRALQSEAHTIWLSLNDAEHAVLLALMAGQPVDARSVEAQALIEKQLVVRTDSALSVAPPLFRSYLKSQIANR